MDGLRAAESLMATYGPDRMKEIVMDLIHRSNELSRAGFSRYIDKHYPEMDIEVNAYYVELYYSPRNRTEGIKLDNANKSRPITHAVARRLTLFSIGASHAMIARYEDAARPTVASSIAGYTSRINRLADPRDLEPSLVNEWVGTAHSYLAKLFPLRPFPVYEYEFDLSFMVREVIDAVGPPPFKGSARSSENRLPSSAEPGASHPTVTSTEPAQVDDSVTVVRQRDPLDAMRERFGTDA